MVTGKKKKEKITEIYFDEDSPVINIRTYNTDLKNRFCSSFAKDSETCSMHYIREKVIYNLVLEDMRQVFDYVTNQEVIFANIKLADSEANKKKELNAKRRELEKAQKRIAQIDKLILKLYEDNASGKITNERFASMSNSLEAEQTELKEKVPALETEINTEQEKADGIQKFIKKVKQLTRPTKLTPELLNEFIEKIIVSQTYYADGKRCQDIEIHYNDVGVIKTTADELERRYQNGDFTGAEIIEEIA